MAVNDVLTGCPSQAPGRMWRLVHVCLCACVCGVCVCVCEVGRRSRVTRSSRVSWRCSGVIVSDMQTSQEWNLERQAPFLI